MARCRQRIETIPTDFQLLFKGYKSDVVIIEPRNTGAFDQSERHRSCDFISLPLISDRFQQTGPTIQYQSLSLLANGDDRSCREG
jgi:hypothetical protein